ncbi:MAG: hypothetical protein HYW24_05420 [Candidatus Aenigmarchaeota archaeon]|nr:hypothetical protein [Candidatus Aenigmarchaeota archaeon]
MFSDEEVEVRILLKMDKRGKWGGAYTSVDNIKKGWNIRDIGKEGLKRVDKLTKELIRKGFILSKPTSYGLEVSLNPRFSQEIISLIRKYFQEGPVV